MPLLVLMLALTLVLVLLVLVLVLVLVLMVLQVQVQVLLHSALTLLIQMLMTTLFRLQQYHPHHPALLLPSPQLSASSLLQMPLPSTPSNQILNHQSQHPNSSSTQLSGCLL